MLERLLGLVPASLHGRSGSVLYSGRRAFGEPSRVYLLGLNPGGSSEHQANQTIGRHMEEALHRLEPDWSEYRDGVWEGRPPGTHGMQPQVLHMLRGLGLAPGRVPASNVVFVRSRAEADLRDEKPSLLRACWPMHQAVIEGLAVRLVLCFGGTAGDWVRRETGATAFVGEFVERNKRGWASRAHRNAAGLHVVTVTHPGRTVWTNPDADPTPFVAALLDELP